MTTTDKTIFLTPIAEEVRARVKGETYAVRPGLPIPHDLDIRVEPKPEVERKVSETGASKDSRLARFDMIPTYPLRLLAERFGKGAEKYPSVNGMDNFRHGYPWSLSYAAMMRHAVAFWGGEDIDPDSGQPHLAAVAWHAMVLMEWSRHPELVKRYDDRQCPREVGQ